MVNDGFKELNTLPTAKGAFEPVKGMKNTCAVKAYRMQHIRGVVSCCVLCSGACFY